MYVHAYESVNNRIKTMFSMFTNSMLCIYVYMCALYACVYAYINR